MEPISKIGDTPLSICVYSVETSPTQMHDKGTLEIIFCLKGSVKFSYAYEEFTLHAGEYISVDRDAYYLYDGKDNICVSFYIDLHKYEGRYPFICNNLFVCEGLAESTMPYPTENHDRLKGLLIAMLKCVIGRYEADKAKKQVDKIVELFIRRFDIFSFHTGIDTLEGENFDRLHKINDYLNVHLQEKVTVADLARELNLTEGYVSEYMRKMSAGFRGMMGYIRVNESEKYLIKTDKTIIEISEECGFSDVKYYYSAFKRWYKCTPNQFRKKYGSFHERHIEYLPLQSITDLLDETLMNHYMEIFTDS